MTTTNLNATTRHYPSQYVSPWTMKGGIEVTIRPIRAEDEPSMVKFHETLSDRTVYLRYFSSLSLAVRTAHERLVRICLAITNARWCLWRSTEIRKPVSHTYWAWGGLISCRRIKPQNWLS